MGVCREGVRSFHLAVSPPPVLLLCVGFMLGRRVTPMLALALQRGNCGGRVFSELPSMGTIQ